MTKAKLGSSSDDDELNESAATMQRPLPPQVRALNAAPPAPVLDNPFAAFENDEVDDEGAIATEALIRPDLKLPDAGVSDLQQTADLTDNLPTAQGQKKVRLPTPLPLHPAAPLKTPMAMSLSTLDEPPVRGSMPSLPPSSPPSSPPPESGMTRVGPVQPKTASVRPAFQQAPQVAPVPLLNVPPPVLQKKGLPPHRIALAVSMVLLAVAIFILVRRNQQANAMAAPPPADAISAATAPVEVAPAPMPTTTVIAPAPIPSYPIAASPVPTPQAQPQTKARRPVRAAVRPAIPVHREQ